jgi:hypothetical protein
MRSTKQPSHEVSCTLRQLPSGAISLQALNTVPAVTSSTQSVHRRTLTSLHDQSILRPQGRNLSLGTAVENSGPTCGVGQQRHIDMSTKESHSDQAWFLRLYKDTRTSGTLLVMGIVYEWLILCLP